MSSSIDSMPALQHILNTTYYIEAVKPMPILEAQAIPSALYIRASTQAPVAASPTSYA